ncbi:MAG TPA: sugar phosphate isomerase [Microbacterium sp.]|uniref:TIM barrel protein n=1 Tax=Microbacterium sp. TaxID=51671 RepID=UPI002C12B638|nr:sugar phosphate isomerase [Microbacterium sp.]HWI30583.1 sugar phosphate isomerase [Microbacterium sp.]
MNATPLLGVTLYSFNHDWVAGRFDLDALLAAVAESGVGPGVEVVGFQSFRNFLALGADEIRSFRDSLDRYELIPTCLGSTIDVAIRRDRYLTTEERVDYLLPQMRAAHALGFPTVRIQLGADTAVLEAVVPEAERLGLRLGMEIHAPEGPNSGAVQRVRESYERIGSDCLGFIPDFSSTMNRVTPGLLRSFTAAGLTPDLAEILEEIWAEDGDPGERLGRFRAIAERHGASQHVIEAVTPAFTINGHVDPAEWADIIHQVFHIHAKFYEIDESGNESAIDYFANLAPFARAGYSGSISSEWEAHPWTPEAEMDTFDLIRRQQQLIRRAFEQLESEAA